MTLEAVQKFYQEILEEPRRAILVENELIEFCRSENQSHHRPVVTLVLKEKNTKEIYYHAVTLKESKFDITSNVLSLTLLDSRAETGETTVTLPVYTRKNGQLYLRTRPKIGEWRLGDTNCYHLEF